MKETTVEVILPAVYDGLPEICNRLERLEQKAPQIIDWNTDSNLNDYVLPGTYICNNGLRTKQGDNLPITNLGENARFGFTLVVTQATSNENGNHHQVIGQSLILTNRLGSETKHYSRSKKYVINNAANPPEVTEDLWSPWQELQGTTYLGQVTKSQLDKVIDNGIYTGVVMDNELLPQGSTFTMLVMNNYAVNSAVGMPAQARQVSQTFFALPLSDVSTGAIVPQSALQLIRIGFGANAISWSYPMRNELTQILIPKKGVLETWNIDLYSNAYVSEQNLPSGNPPYINIKTNISNGIIRGVLLFESGSTFPSFYVNGLSITPQRSSKLAGTGYLDVVLMIINGTKRLICTTHPTDK